MKKLLITAGLLACLVLAGCTGPSSQFKERGAEALDSLKRLDDAHMDGLLSYQPHLLDAEKAVDAAHRAQSESAADKEAATTMDSYFAAIKYDRQLADLQLEYLRVERDLANYPKEWTKKHQAEYDATNAGYDDDHKMRRAEMDACRNELSDRLNGDLRSAGECLKAGSAAADKAYARAVADMKTQ